MKGRAVTSVLKRSTSIEDEEETRDELEVTAADGFIGFFASFSSTCSSSFLLSFSTCCCSAAGVVVLELELSSSSLLFFATAKSLGEEVVTAVVVVICFNELAACLSCWAVKVTI